MRLAHWEENLNAVVVTALERRFRWGTHDCASFAFGCVLALTGRDLYREYVGRYKTQATADEVLRSIGGFTDFTSSHFETVDVGAALVGDLGLAKSGTLCVCAAPGRWIAPSARALATTFSEEIVRAWRVA